MRVALFHYLVAMPGGKRAHRYFVAHPGTNNYIGPFWKRHEAEVYASGGWMGALYGTIHEHADLPRGARRVGWLKWENKTNPEQKGKIVSYWDCQRCGRDAAGKIIVDPQCPFHYHGPKQNPNERCVVCGKPLKPGRTHVDTCGERCYRQLLEKQRDAAFGVDRGIKPFDYEENPMSPRRARHYLSTRGSVPAQQATVPEYTIEDEDERIMREVHSAAHHLARNGLTGAAGDPLPSMMSAKAVSWVSKNINKFRALVKIASEEG